MLEEKEYPIISCEVANCTHTTRRSGCVMPAPNGTDVNNESIHVINCDTCPSRVEAGHTVYGCGSYKPMNCA